MGSNREETDEFLVGRARHVHGEAHLEVRFDMGSGRQLLEDLFATAVKGELWSGTRMDVMRAYPRNNIKDIAVHRLPFGPHWPLATTTFVRASDADMDGIDPAGSEALWHDLRRLGIILEDGTPAPRFLLEAPKPLTLEGWSREQCAYVRARTFTHMRPLAYAELTPHGGLKIVADRFVLTQIVGGLRQSMGNRPVIDTGERLCLMPDPRFCFDKGARDCANQTVGKLDLIGLYAAPGEALDLLAHHLDCEAESFEGVVFDV